MSDQVLLRAPRRDPRRGARRRLRPRLRQEPFLTVLYAILSGDPDARGKKGLPDVVAKLGLVLPSDHHIPALQCLHPSVQVENLRTGETPCRGLIRCRGDAFSH